MIHRNYSIDPLELTDQEWTRLYNEYLFTNDLRLKNLETVFKSALRVVASEVMEAINRAQSNE